MNVERTIETVGERDDTRERVLGFVDALGGRVIRTAGEAARVELPDWQAVVGLGSLMSLDAAEYDPEIVRLAMLLGDAPRALAWVQSHVEWRDEPGERLVYPSTTLHRLAGDCDDSAMLVAALTAALGYPSALVACTINGEPVHGVAAVCLGDSSSWLWADPTEPGPMRPWSSHPLERDERRGRRGIIRPKLVGVPDWPGERG